MFSVSLDFGRKQATLTFSHGEKILESETWAFDVPVCQSERQECVRFAFDELYDYMNESIHGPVEFDGLEQEGEESA